MTRANTVLRRDARRKIEDSMAYPDDRKHWLYWFQDLYDIEDRGAVMLSCTFQSTSRLQPSMDASTVTSDPTVAHRSASASEANSHTARPSELRPSELRPSELRRIV